MRSTRWNRGREADLANTKKPHWHKSRESTVERRDTVLPPMLAPVMTVHPGRSSKSSEVNCSPPLRQILRHLGVNDFTQGDGFIGAEGGADTVVTQGQLALGHDQIQVAQGLHVG